MYLVMLSSTPCGNFATLDAAKTWILHDASTLKSHQIYTYRVYWVRTNTNKDTTWVCDYQHWPSTGHKEWMTRPDFKQPEVTPAEKFAYDLLAGDPIALDALEDVLCGKR